MIGRNLRMLRNRRGISQTQLAEQLGITFQQVQKYEKGSNRISASTLLEIAKALNFDVLDFFANASEPPAEVPSVRPVASPDNKLDLMIIRRLSELKDARVKKKLLHLLESLTEGEQTRSAVRTGTRSRTPAPPLD